MCLQSDIQQLKYACLLLRRGSDDIGDGTADLNGFLADTFQDFNNVVKSIFSGLTDTIGIIKQFYPLVHVPHSIISKHANKDMAPDAAVSLMVNRPDFKLDSFHATESLLDPHQAFVVVDSFYSGHIFRGNIGESM